MSFSSTALLAILGRDVLLKSSGGSSTSPRLFGNGFVGKNTSIIIAGITFTFLTFSHCLEFQRKNDKRIGILNLPGQFPTATSCEYDNVRSCNVEVEEKSVASCFLKVSWQSCRCI